MTHPFNVVIVVCNKTEFNAIFNKVFEWNSLETSYQCKFITKFNQKTVSRDFEKVNFIN